MKKNYTALFYTCSLIEYIARATKNERAFVVNTLGDNLSRIYKYHDIFHCEPIEKVADEFIEKTGIRVGDFDNVSACRYTVPDYWDIGEVFARLIEDTTDDTTDVATAIKNIYGSWIAEKILNFNSDLYYHSREYLATGYIEGHVIAA